MSSVTTIHTMAERIQAALCKLVKVNADEIRPLYWCWLYIFVVLSAYYVIRPVRDTFAIAGGTQHLQWLFSATLVTMLLLNLPFSALSQRLPRQRFISLSYRFFSACLLVFAVLLLLANDEQRVWAGRVFFVWVSVFNLFVVSIFWSLVVDIFNSERGKRLFGLMAVGATLGAMLGSVLTATLIDRLGPVGLFILSACLLELAVLCVRKLTRLAPTLSVTRDAPSRDDNSPLGGTFLAGIINTFRSPYLSNICLYMLLYSVTSTFLYFFQAELVQHAFQSDNERTTFFATLDLWVNLLTLAIQLLLTSRLLLWFGTASILALLPFATGMGFLMLSMWPILPVLVVFSVLRRASNFAIARPAREVLFTVLSRENKYKAKNFIDTVIYRTGDQAGAWVWSGMGAAGLSGMVLAWVAIPLSFAWMINSLWLGHRQQRLNNTPVTDKTS